MFAYIIICRTLTEAERINRMLNASGISAKIVRVPAYIAREGCAFGVGCNSMESIVLQRALERNGIRNRVYFSQSGMRYAMLGGDRR